MRSSINNGLVTITFDHHTAHLPLSAFDMLPVRVYVKNDCGAFIYANSTCIRELGASTKEELLGKSDFDFFKPDLSEKWLCQERALLDGQSQPIDQSEEEVFLSGDRSWVHTAKFRVTGENGAPFGIIGVTRDTSESQIHQSQSLNILNTVPTMVFTKQFSDEKDKFTFTFANSALCEAVGKDLTAIIGFDDVEVLGNTPEVKSFREIDLYVHRNAKPVTRQESFIHAVHGRRVLSTTKVPIYDPRRPTQMPVGVLGVATDVTDFIAAQDQLSEQANLLSALLAYTPAALFIKDAEGRFLLANAELARLVNASSADDMLGKRDCDFFSEEYARETMAEEESLLQAGVPITNISRKTVVNGEEVTRLVSKVPLKNAENRLTRVLGVSQDITLLTKAKERAETAEAELRQQSEMLRTVINTLPQQIYLKNVFGEYILCNTAFCRHHGAISPLDIDGKTDRDLWPDSEAASQRAKDLEIIRSGNSAKLIEEHIMPHGRQVTLETTRLPIFDATSGKPVSVLGVSEDFVPRTSPFRVRRSTFFQLCSQIRESSDTNRRYFLLLLGVTHVHGLQFNRCTLWKYKDALAVLNGLFAIGQESIKEAGLITPDVLRLEIEDCIASFDIGPVVPDSTLVRLVQRTSLELIPKSVIHLAITESVRTGVPQIIPLLSDAAVADISDFLTLIEATRPMLIVIPVNGITLVGLCDNVRNGVPVEQSGLEDTIEYCSLVQRAFNDAIEREQRRTQKATQRAWQEVAWHVAHKMDSILPATLTSLNQVIADANAGADVDALRSELEIIVAPLRRAANLINEFRGYANPADVDVSSVATVDEVVELFVSVFCFHKLRATGSCKKAIQHGICRVDRKRLEECAHLMAQNARELNDEFLTVHVEADDATASDRFRLGRWLDSGIRWIRFSIADNGPGVPIERKQKIFEPGESNRASGTGFGLAHVKRIVEAHGGGVFEDGDEKTGARFVVLLKVQTERERS